MLAVHHGALDEWPLIHGLVREEITAVSRDVEHRVAPGHIGARSGRGWPTFPGYRPSNPRNESAPSCRRSSFNSPRWPSMIWTVSVKFCPSPGFDGMGMVNCSPELSRGDSSGAESVGVGLPPSALGYLAAKASVAALSGDAKVLAIRRCAPLPVHRQRRPGCFHREKCDRNCHRRQAPGWSSMSLACCCRNGCQQSIARHC